MNVFEGTLLGDSKGTPKQGDTSDASCFELLQFCCQATGKPLASQSKAMVEALVVLCIDLETFNGYINMWVCLLKLG